jgi:alpha-galactosidase
MNIAPRQFVSRTGMICALFCAAATIALSGKCAVTNTPAEMALKIQWVQRNLLGGSNSAPFSLNFNGQASSTSNLFSSWTRSSADTVLDSARTRHTLLWTNSSNGLQVKCVAVEYLDFPVVEWTVYLTNGGPANTPIIQAIQGLDTTLSRLAGDPEFVLNGNQGDFMTADSYEPWQKILGPNSENDFGPAGSGKSTEGPTGWPYYDLQTPGGGMILAIGWPGNWGSSFTRDSATGLRIQAGQKLTHLYLKPGETIRTPLITLMFWQGTDVVRAQNLWRHYYLAHVIPRVNGQPPPALAQIQVTAQDTNAVNEFLQAGIALDICWRDAGGSYTWYPNTNGPYTGGDAYLNTGTWDVDAVRYPVGFKPFSDWIHARGLKFLLWNEPERVGDTNSWLGANHPEWLLHPGSVGLILNEGNPEAFNWLTNHFDNLIKTQGIDWYREDMNGGGPGTSWTANDASDRQGITENFYVQGHLAYWDALLKMNPGLRIDSCASGGRRNDLETMKRAVPMTRTDFEFAYMPNVVDGNQCQTYGIASWLPFYGTGAYIYDVYSFRSFYMTLFGMGGLSPDNKAAQQQAYAECRKVAPCMLYGDYYPLTPYSLADNVWIGWQFDRPDTGDGCVQMFRRTNSVVSTYNIKLHGLDPAKYYAVRDFDKGDLGWFSAGQLMTNGLTLTLAPRQSSILSYAVTNGVLLTATATPSVGLPPFQVQFHVDAISTTGSPLTYLWDFGDGDASTEQNPAHTYKTASNFVATVTVQDGLAHGSVATVLVKSARPQKAMKIAFPGYSRAETLTNFPVLVTFGTNLSAAGFSYGQMASPDGWDLLFATSDGATILNHEIEQWNPGGNSYVWVQIPQLTSNTWIWAYWGDPNLASSQPAFCTNGSVWADGYVGVWHFGESTGPPFDSTANALTATTNRDLGFCAPRTAAMIGNGCAFGGGYASTTATTLPAGSNPRSMSAWFKKTSATTAAPGKEIVGYGDNSLMGNRFSFWINGNGVANALGVENGGAARTFPWSWDNQWHHLAATLPPGQSDLSGVTVYYDGLANGAVAGSGTLHTVQTELCFAAIPGYHTTDASYNLDGVLDEVRFSNVARSANWEWAEYQSASAHSQFNSYGNVSDFVPAPAVNLSIAWSTANAIISWTTNSAVSAILQESADLIHWTNTVVPVVVQGGSNTVTIAPQNQAQFYRLMD